jgi:signal transduction histidine kinase
MDRTGAPKPTFLWRGILILLPLLLLAGVGLYSLRQDRLLAEVEARERCQNLAANYAATISTRLLARMESLSYPKMLSEQVIVDAQGNLFSIDGSRQRAKIPRDPNPQPLSETDLSPAQSNAWHEARWAEFIAPEFSINISAWRKFLGTSPPAPYLNRAKYDLGLLLAGHNQLATADQLFSEVESNRDAATESGLPLWLLAELQRVQLAPSRLGNIYQDAVNNPCFVTPLILARLAQLDPAPSPENRKWLDTWEKDQAARDFYLHTQTELAARPMQPRSFWTKWDGNEWLVLVRPMDSSSVALLPYKKELVGHALRDVLTNTLSQASYSQPGVEIAGMTIIPIEPQWPVWGSAQTSLFPENPNSVAVSEALSQPGVLYAQQKQRTAWFAALILVSAMAALVGFVSAYRGFHQQLRLSEMKSNFVSSVSHELRAPIASMRLMSESLQRGKVSDATKQNEYFGFLVQESRRLSSLIENILDFSRIEQGRKKYQFEPTDLDFLVEQTVKLMQPCAAEHGVELKLQKTDAAKPAVVHCDGLAIQQALINLIDNAVKHSPSGAEVAIGLERSPGNFRLWVEDRGPGIPGEEHERIFERFYRRGSELRRETQGIGIGLSIVKHSVEAHGGRVVLRSAVGEGSRFTIELPDKPPAVEHE